MNSPELDRLLVESILDLDASAHHIESLQDRIWQAHADTLETWSQSNGWVGEFDIVNDLVVLPDAWTVDDKRQAWFELTFGPNEDELGLYFGLSTLVGARGQVCLWFRYRGLRNPWKAAARQHAEALQKLGFVMTPYGDFYTECSPQAGKMADAVESGHFEPATAPVAAALDRAKAAQPAFTAILRQLDAI